MADLVGKNLQGRYRIEGLIGRGGMAEVYKVWDMRRQYRVAIKVMREDLAEDVEFLQRFKQEAQALAALSHANIVRFYSFEREGRLAFIVMDYVEGTTLRRRILEAQVTPLSLDEVWSVTQQICGALHYAHEENVLHRDVKPGNIMIEPGGRILVADFGIAKAADAATATTVMPGTPAYMSPEQCRSEPLDARTDVYSVGIIVYEMLTGQRPFVGNTEATTGSTREKLRWEQMHATPPPLRQSNPRIPPEVEDVVLKALAKDREQRWSSVMAFWYAFDTAFGMAGLKSHAEGVFPAPAPSVGPVTPPAPMPVQTPAAMQPAAGIAKPVSPAPYATPGSPAASNKSLAALLRQIPIWSWVLLAAVVVALTISFVRIIGQPEEAAVADAPAPTTQVTVVVTATLIEVPTLPPPTAEPTATADEVATEVAKAAAVAATLTAAAPTHTPTVTPTPSSTPSPTPTWTGTPTRTPTARPTSTTRPTSPPKPKPTATRTRTGIIYPVPEPVSPDDWAGFKGRDTEVMLVWRSNVRLAKDEYFLVETRTGPNFEVHAQHLVRAKELQLPPIYGHVEYWTTFGQKTEWTVTIVRAVDNQVKERRSPASVARHLVWTEVN
jgi:serine/threonine-protein kinase